MSNNPFANWTQDMADAHNRKVEMWRKSKSIHANAFEQMQREKVQIKALPIQKIEQPAVKEIPKQARRGKWVEVGGKRFYARSEWERKYACLLECLKTSGHILDWEFEGTVFWFEGIRRGTNNYKPDFKVWMPDGTIEFREVKGFMDRKSKTKIRRMKKYHPDVKLRVFGKEWWKRHGKTLALCVPGWRM